MLRHAAGGDTLHVGDERAALLDQRLLHAALDARREQLDPLKFPGLCNDVGRTHSDRRVGFRDVARGRVGRNLDELYLRGDLLPGCDLVMHHRRNQYLARRFPARPLAHWMRIDMQPDIVDELRRVERRVRGARDADCRR